MMSPDEMRSFGARLRALREARKLSRDELGRMLGEELGGAPVTGQSIYRWERGLMEPESDKQEALARIFGVSKLFLTYGVRSAAPPALDPVTDTSRPLAEMLLDDYRDNHGYGADKVAWIREQLPSYMFSSGATALTISSSIESLSAEYDRQMGLKIPPPKRERVAESHDTGRGGMRLPPSKKKR